MLFKLQENPLFFYDNPPSFLLSHNHSVCCSSASNSLFHICAWSVFWLSNLSSEVTFKDFSVSSSLPPLIQKSFSSNYCFIFFSLLKTIYNNTFTLFNNGLLNFDVSSIKLEILSTFLGSCLPSTWPYLLNNRRIINIYWINDLISVLLVYTAATLASKCLSSLYTNLYKFQLLQFRPRRIRVPPKTTPISSRIWGIQPYFRIKALYNNYLRKVTESSYWIIVLLRKILDTYFISVVADKCFVLQNKRHLAWSKSKGPCLCSVFFLFWKAFLFSYSVSW